MAIRVKFPSSGDDSSDSWISISDMMAGLMMIFLLLAVWYISEIPESENISEEGPSPEETALTEVGRIAEDLQKRRDAIYQDLRAKFGKSREGAETVCGLRIQVEPDLTVEFLRSEEFSDIFFQQGEAELPEDFMKLLDKFFPCYMEVLNGFSGDIREVRIEGHTSSEWGNLDRGDAFIRNMRLSQDRARATLEYALNLDGMDRYEDWIIKKMTANALSSGRLVTSEAGGEDEIRSRRVVFTIHIEGEERALPRIRDLLRQNTPEGAE
ncbi:MAG: OmpA family protein [Alphaproteobacteria bacterium]|nr:OmpA family protein [Alphaproteobacteria bacterium]